MHYSTRNVLSGKTCQKVQANSKHDKDLGHIYLYLFLFHKFSQKICIHAHHFQIVFRGPHSTQNQKACWMLLWCFKMVLIWNRQTLFFISRTWNMCPRTHRTANNSIKKHLLPRCKKHLIFNYFKFGWLVKINKNRICWQWLGYDVALWYRY